MPEGREGGRGESLYGGLRVNGGQLARRAGRAAGLFALAALLTGCALAGGKPAPLDTYDLPAVGGPGKARHGRAQLLVNEPTAIKSLDGQDVVVRPQPGSITFLKGAQWGDRLPKVIQAALVASFQNSGAFGGVGRPGEGLAIDYQLISDIRAFEIDASGAPVAHVLLSVRILNDRNGEVRAQRNFEAEVLVSGKENDDYMRALAAAFRDTSDEIVAWVVRII